MGDADRSTGGKAFNGNPRIRGRASGGQDMDPHSVDKQKRRDTIGQNLKALHELVPKANKTDRASMVDEIIQYVKLLHVSNIIEYVKLLQMQIKVLSASKLDSNVGSVGPLTRNVAAEASAGLLEPGSSLFKEGREFEQNIVKYMERDMNGATEYLRSKGLCLIPVAQPRALFDSISNEGQNPGLGSSRASDSISNESRNAETITSRSGVLGMGAAGSGSDLALKGNKAIKKGKELVPTDKSNEADSL